MSRMKDLYLNDLAIAEDVILNYLHYSNLIRERLLLDYKYNEDIKTLLDDYDLDYDLYDTVWGSSIMDSIGCEYMNDFEYSDYVCTLITDLKADDYFLNKAKEIMKQRFDM